LRENQHFYALYPRPKGRGFTALIGKVGGGNRIYYNQETVQFFTRGKGSLIMDFNLSFLYANS
jgi:hypothetical protein